MNVNRGVILGALLALALAVMLFCVKFVPETSPPHDSLAASGNPFLAAGQLLELRGSKVHFQPTFTQTPKEPGALLLTQSPGSIPLEEQRRLKHWVEDGNLLMLSASSMRLDNAKSDKNADLLVSPLGLKVIRADDEDEEKDEEESSAPASQPADDAKKAEAPSAARQPAVFGGSRIPWILIDEDEGYLQARFNPQIRLEDTKNRAIGALSVGHRIHALRYRLGRGTLIVVSDVWLFQNRAIGVADHAALFLRLLEKPPRKGDVWINYDADYPSLFELIWRYAYPLVISLGVFVLFWVWRVSRRFGPLLPGVVAPRRRLSEHLQASGRYLWFAGQQARLYQSMRQGFRQRLLKRHAGWRHLTDDELIAELSRQSSLSIADLRQALISTSAPDLHRFLRDMRVINHLRKLT